MSVGLLMTTIISGNSFVAEQQIMVGVNTHAVTEWGTEMYSTPTAADVDMQFKAAQNMGVKVIRIFATNSNVDDWTNAQRIDAMLSQADSYGLSVVVSLVQSGCWAVTNGVCQNGYFPQKLESYYQIDPSRNSLVARLQNSFFTDGTGVTILKSFLNTVISYNKYHNNIYAWEWGIEMDQSDVDTSNHASTLINFMNDIHTYIHGLDPNHPQSTGLSHEKIWAQNPAFYTGLANYEIISIHPYDGDQYPSIRTAMANIADWAVSNGKSVLVGEFGLSGSNRVTRARAEIEFWKQHGVSAILQWGFMADGVNTNSGGAGYDSVYGMDMISHQADYSGLYSLYSFYNKISPSTTP